MLFVGMSCQIPLDLDLSYAYPHNGWANKTDGTLIRKTVGRIAFTIKYMPGPLKAVRYALAATGRRMLPLDLC